MRMWKRSSGPERLLLLGFPVLLACLTLSVFLPGGAVSSGALWRALWGLETEQAAGLILFQVRLPRALGAVCCGAGLSVSGLLLQSALDNRLASPGIIGVNAGAGLFALLAGLFFPLQALARSGAAFLGAIAAVGLVQRIVRRAGFTRSAVILSGVAVSSLLTALSQGIVTFYPEAVGDRVAFSLGGLHGLDGRQILFALPFLGAGLLLALLLAGGIDLFPLGDEAAQGLGLNVQRWRRLTLLCAAVLAGAAVSLCGLLGFVGLMVPNLIRLAHPGSCRQQIGLCCLWGSSFLLLCDCIARLLFYPFELPVGLLLSCLGAPFFAWMLTRRRKGADHA
ncbi:MAG: iron ABC transporter permease [Oscillospiraceae bacterium]|nr:iron ABC transporter permease [Oscillospiraceae bacterium]MBQ9411870.1 iron ABC transporter permease [Oscillospiraceae bacterium]